MSNVTLDTDRIDDINRPMDYSRNTIHDLTPKDMLVFECPNIRHRYMAIDARTNNFPLECVKQEDRMVVLDIIKVCLSFPRQQRPVEPKYETVGPRRSTTRSSGANDANGDTAAAGGEKEEEEDEDDMDVTWTIDPHPEGHYYDLIFKYMPRTFIAISALNRILQFAPGSIDTTYTGILNDAKDRTPVVRVRVLMHPYRCHTESALMILQSPPVFYIPSQTPGGSGPSGTTTDADVSIAVKRRHGDVFAPTIIGGTDEKRRRVHTIPRRSDGDTRRKM